MKMVITFDIPLTEYLNDELNWGKTEDEICEDMSLWTYAELVEFCGAPTISFEKDIDKSESL